MNRTIWKTANCVAAAAGVLICLCGAPPAEGAQSEIDRCIAKLEKSYEAMKDFHARFEQETHLASINRVEKGEGQVYFKKLGKMLWEYRKPEVQKIILDGQNLWFYRPDEKQVMKNNFSVVPKHILLDLFRGKIKIQQKFKVIFIQHEIKDKQETVVLEMVPIVYDPTLTRVTLWVDPKESHVVRSQIEDEFGTKTILNFFDIKVNGGLKDSLFKFEPPPDVDVFEPPSM